MRICLMFIASLLPIAAPAATCLMQPLVVAGNHARFGDIAVTLDQPDDPAQPDAWIGPIHIQVGAGPVCQTSTAVSIITRQLWLGNRTLYATTYSGSEYRTYGIDVPTCRTTWVSKPFTGAARVEPGALVLSTRRIALHAGCTVRPPHH